MKPIAIVLVLLFSLAFGNCYSQTKTKMKINSNPLICNPQTGICETGIATIKTEANTNGDSSIKTVQIIYFTDPICSSCWAIEPNLRKLKLEYGHHLEIAYKMGGLLKDWSYNSGGISKPSDVAHHWDEVSVYYNMPIDGDVWLEDPLMSSYPPSIAFKAAQMQNADKAILFLRAIREMVFLQKKNITQWEHIAKAAQMVGLDTAKLHTDYEGPANGLFEEDLRLAQAMGVRGFPTLFFIDNMGNTEILYGMQPYKSYEAAIKKIDTHVTKMEYNKHWENLFAKYQSLTVREFAELAELPKETSEKLLNELCQQKLLKKMNTKNGAMYSLQTLHQSKP
jgi:putative protein-disulfide isomerase